MAAEGQTESRVILSSEGDEGKYNRANRSLYHFIENSMSVALGIALGGFVFPFPTFVVVMIFFFGRLLYTSGYVVGYGKHAGGFMIATFCSMTLNGMLLLVSFKAM